MYTDTYENAPTEHYGHANQYSQPPQYSQADQFISSPLPQIAPLQDQEMLLQEVPQDTGLFHMPTENQMQFQDEHMPSATIDESLVSQHIPQMVNEPMHQDQPETPGNVRITRSRLRGKLFFCTNAFELSYANINGILLQVVIQLLLNLLRLPQRCLIREKRPKNEVEDQEGLRQFANKLLTKRRHLRRMRACMI